VEISVNGFEMTQSLVLVVHRSRRCHFRFGCQAGIRIGKLAVLIKVHGVARNATKMYCNWKQWPKVAVGGQN